MRVLICGGRNYGDDPAEVYRMETVLMALDPRQTTIIQGGARGADHHARKIAVHYGMSVEEYPADWKKHGKAAGPIRNQEMIDDGKPDFVIAFPGGRGTADMVSRARQAGLPVLKLYTT